jgi:hypothetical protein
MVRKYTIDIKEAGFPLKSKPVPNGGLYFEKEQKE